MTCRRCSGLVIEEEFCDCLDGEICFSGSRCLLCGAIEEPVILRNRRRPPEPRNRQKARLFLKVAALSGEKHEEG